MAKRKTKPWDKMSGETDSSYKAFMAYLAIGNDNLGKGKDRSYPKTAQICSKSLSLIKFWARKFNWMKRAEEWDKSIIDEAHEKAVNDYAEMIERHIKLGQFLQKKAYEGLQDREMKKASFHSLSDMMNKGVDIEKNARDMAKVDENKNLENEIDKMFANVLTDVWEKVEGTDENGG